MIEVPSAAVMADSLAEAADFFSIGTNDLVQYVMAVDRTNSELADLASALQPAVLRLIDGVVRAARVRGRHVAVCGEAAADPAVIPFLVGLGVTDLSVGPGSVVAVRSLVANLDVAWCRGLAARALTAASLEEVQALVCLATRRHQAGATKHDRVRPRGHGRARGRCGSAGARRRDHRRAVRSLGPRASVPLAAPHGHLGRRRTPRGADLFHGRSGRRAHRPAEDRRRGRSRASTSGPDGKVSRWTTVGEFEPLGASSPAERDATRGSVEDLGLDPLEHRPTGSGPRPWRARPT